MKLAKQIRAARKRAGLSQSEAARQWGVSIRTLQQWEQARSEPMGLAKTKLQEILGSTKRRPSKKSSGRKE
jgi:DNA-binding transcriptional regulator YiaG